ncbi:MAG TPA: sensor domain-containing diguanylate cyclase [Mycobacteriales bacterium]|nr:sensor domain-containing diguanylate cyclase [Mycobacteriales bacterium]
MGVVFRGCVDREGVILSIDETSDTVGRAGMPVRNLIAPADRDGLGGLLRDPGWPGIAIRTVALHTDAPAVLVAAAVHRLIDVALIPDEETDPMTALRIVLSSTADEGSWILDADGGTIAVSPRMTALLGAPPESLWDRLDEDRAAQVRPELGKKPWRQTVATHSEGGGPVELIGVPVAGPDGTVIGSLVRASTDLGAVEDSVRLVRTTLHDPLTGLPGRTHLLDRLTGTAEERGLGLVALLRCAVEGFTIINDSHGHQAGNEVLVQISDRLRAVLGPHDYLARLGGDEFVLLSTGLSSREEVQPIADRLLGAFAEPFRVGSTALEVFSSIGVVCYEPERSEFSGPTLLERAGTAMRRAKTDSLAGGWAEYEDK